MVTSEQARIEELERALSMVEWELGENGLHRESCPGSHPAHCECSTGVARRYARHALEKKPAPATCKHNDVESETRAVCQGCGAVLGS